MAAPHVVFDLFYPLDLEVTFYAQRRTLRNVAALIALDGVDAFDQLAASHGQRGETIAEIEAQPDWHDVRDVKFHRLVRLTQT